MDTISVTWRGSFVSHHISWLLPQGASPDAPTLSSRSKKNAAQSTRAPTVSATIVAYVASKRYNRLLWQHHRSIVHHLPSCTTVPSTRTTVPSIPTTAPLSTSRRRHTVQRHAEMRPERRTTDSCARKEQRTTLSRTWTTCGGRLSLSASCLHFTNRASTRIVLITHHTPHSQIHPPPETTSVMLFIRLLVRAAQVRKRAEWSRQGRVVRSSRAPRATARHRNFALNQPKSHTYASRTRTTLAPLPSCVAPLSASLPVGLCATN